MNSGMILSIGISLSLFLGISGEPLNAFLIMLVIKVITSIYATFEEKKLVEQESIEMEKEMKKLDDLLAEFAIPWFKNNEEFVQKGGSLGPAAGYLLGLIVHEPVEMSGDKYSFQGIASSISDVDLIIGNAAYRKII